MTIKIIAFQPCESNDYNDCDTENANDIGTSKKWRSLSEFSGLGNLIIKDVKESNAGLYRCMDNRRIKKLFDVKVRSKTHDILWFRNKLQFLQTSILLQMT